MCNHSYLMYHREKVVTTAEIFLTGVSSLEAFNLKCSTVHYGAQAESDSIPCIDKLYDARTRYKWTS
jgi:hypothetical protein